MTKRFLRNAGIAAFSLMLAIGLVPQRGFAQLTSGDLTGLITDASGAVVPNATVEALNTATGIKTSQSSTSAGEYRFSNLPIGTYDITASGTGFSPATVKGIPIRLNHIATQNFTLQVGQTATTVEVSEAAATIDTNTAQIANSYDSRLTAELPTASFGSGVINLSLLSAGVASGGGVGQGTGPSVGGQRPTNNNFTVEGIDNNSKSVTGPLVVVPNDAVQEFTVLQNQFQAEYGHSSGGQFNTAVKSGTNEFHGVLYEYLLNRNLNAVDQLNRGLSENPRYDQNRLGATFGGPIRKNKLFFFGNYEYNPIGQTSTTGGVTAPTAAGWAALAALPGINANNLKIAQQYTPVAATADKGFDQGATDKGLTLPNGSVIQIPVGTINIAAPNWTNYYRGTFSSDYNVSDKDQLRGRFILNKEDGVDNAAELPAFYLTLPTRY
ncbi:MAG TPA: carboxypeptidase-like regulatory domain-containing protein, partial [Bryobacteraceae bacterium]|nr:carboxypeptidase-like regulatory domain-containing protein [Bryobacteraceae bacterium]